MELSEENEEIWNYKSAVKRTRRKQTLKKNRVTTSPKRKKKISLTYSSAQLCTPVKHSTTSKRAMLSSGKKLVKKGQITPQHSRPRYEGFCPFCQMPFHILPLSPTWHVNECMDDDFPEVECPDGLTCDNTMESHYKEYSHETLAVSRATGTLYDSSGKLSAKVKLAFSTLPQSDIPSTSHSSSNKENNERNSQTDYDSSRTDASQDFTINSKKCKQISSQISQIHCGNIKNISFEGQNEFHSLEGVSPLMKKSTSNTIFESSINFTKIPSCALSGKSVSVIEDEDDNFISSPQDITEMIDSVDIYNFSDVDNDKPAVSDWQDDKTKHKDSDWESDRPEQSVSDWESDKLEQSIIDKPEQRVSDWEDDKSEHKVSDWDEEIEILTIKDIESQEHTLMKSSNEEQRSLTTPECRTKKHKLRKQKDAGKFPPKKFPLMKHVFAKQFDDIFSKVQETDREISEWINNDNESKTIPCSTKKRKSLTQISEDVSPQKQVRKSPILCKIKLSSSGENSQRHSDTESMKNFKKRDVTLKWNDKSPNNKMRLSWSKRKNRKALKKDVNLDNRQQSLTSFFQCSSKSTETVAMQCKKEEELWVISDSQCDVNCTDMKQKEGLLEKQHMNIPVKSQIKYFDSNSENVRMRFKKMKEIRVSDSTGKCDKITPEEESLQKQHHCTPHKSRTTDCDSNSRSPFHLPKHAVTTVKNMVLNAKRINSLSALRRHQIDKIYSVEKNSNSEELTNEEQRINSPEGMTNTEEAVDSPDGMTNIRDVKSADSAEMIRSSGKKSGKMKVSVVKKSAMDILMANRSRKRQDNVTQLQRTELETGINSEGSEIKDDQTRNTGKRGCPFYKKIPETGFTVDAFSYGIIPNCTGYILSHFHYDHYCGLTKNFNQPIYCSQVTANLVISRIKVDEKYVHAIPMNTPCLIDGIEIIMLEANHCPGSVLILLKLKSGRIILHTGDFRADKSMEDYPEFKGIHVSQLYLDTTYCNPSYAFSPQQEVIDFTINLVQQEIKQNANTLVVCGSYTIGKERIFIAIAKALRCKICVYREKKQILSCLDDSDLMQQISLNFNDSQLHVLKLGKLNPQGLTNHLNSLKTKYSNVLALEPTGWSFSKIKSLYEIQPKYNRNGIKIYGIPYSEHSSYLELKRFVQFIRPDRILPTVNNGNPNSRKKMESIFKSWFNEMEKGSSNKVTVKQSALSKWFH